MIDTNTVIRAYLAANAGIIALVGSRIYCPRLPEGATLPAISLFTRGGVPNPHIEKLQCPSVQIDCWADDSIVARRVYRAVFDCLQGLQDASITIGATTYYIKSAILEVDGQDIIDVDVLDKYNTKIQGYFRVLSFWQFMIH